MTAADLSTRDEILTTADVSAITKVPIKTLASWRHALTGPRSFRLGNLIRYRRDDVDAWLAAQYAATDRPTPEAKPMTAAVCTCDACDAYARWVSRLNGEPEVGYYRDPRCPVHQGDQWPDRPKETP